MSLYLDITIQYMSAGLVNAVGHKGMATPNYTVLEYTLCSTVNITAEGYQMPNLWLYSLYALKYSVNVKLSSNWLGFIQRHYKKIIF